MGRYPTPVPRYGYASLLSPSSVCGASGSGWAMPTVPPAVQEMGVALYAPGASCWAAAGVWPAGAAAGLEAPAFRVGAWRLLAGAAALEAGCEAVVPATGAQLLP